jgi:DNA repair protein RecO (recombination protein O)
MSKLSRWLRAESMPLYSGEALVLRTYKLGEADRIVVFLTPDRGKKRGVAKGARRQRSRFLGALEPLTHVNVAYFERENRELVGLNYAEPLRSPLAAHQAGACSAAGYCAALLDDWMPESDAHEHLYRLGVRTLDALAADAPVDRLVRYFEYWVLRLQGVYPSLQRCAGCGRLLAGGACLRSRDHRFVCRDCGPDGGVVMSPSALGFLRGASRVAPERIGEVALAAQASAELEAAHRALLSWHLEKDLRSARVLHEILNGDA